MTAAGRQPTKRLLSIGINQYPLWPADKQLTGCVNDVTALRQLLRDQFGFAEEHMTLLTDVEATRERILAAFDALVAATEPNDIVVLHYAGHGSQITDMEGDEPSGRDSTITPHDSAGWKGENRDITDDEIQLRLDALGARTSFITLIFDCCHSGTITRDVGGPRSRSLPPDTRSKEELLAFRKPVEGTRTASARGPSGWLPIEEKYVLIAGSRDDESSYEYTTPEHEGKKQHGALTYFLMQELVKATSGTTYRDVFERAASRVTAYASAQHPQMEGKIDREVLGLRDIEPMRFIRVLKRDGDTLTLGAGAAHGLTVGSHYSLHPQGTKQASDTSVVGEAEIISVGALTSEARLTSEKESAAIGSNARAVETAHAHGDFRLPVRLEAEPGAALNELRDKLAGSRLLQLTDGGPAVMGRLLAARDRVAPGDPAPNAGILREPRWAVTSETGAFLMSLKGVNETDEILKFLEGTARYRRALDFENTDPDSALAGKFDLELMRVGVDKDGKQTFTAATPDAATNEIMFEEDEAIVFRIRSRHDRDVFISLVDFGISGRVEPILPYKHAGAGSQLKLGPGMTFDYDLRPKMMIKARWPKSYPFVLGEDVTLENLGTGTVKLFVTEQETDFSLLRQEAARGEEDKPRSSLSQLFNGVFQGHATRDAGRDEPADGDWTTVRRSFVVRRRTTQQLGGATAEVNLGAATLSAPGLSGTATTHLGTKGREVAAAMLNDNLRNALAASAMTDGQTVEVTGAQQTGPSTRSVGDQPAMELRLNAPAEGFGQVVLATDEVGVVTWHIAAEGGGGTRGAAAAPTRRYLVPQSVPAEQAAGTRGVLGVLGKKILKELVFPLIDPIVGEVGAMFVHNMEKARWPYRVRPFAPNDYTSDATSAVSADDWQRLSKGRALLFVHGTFSRAHLAFGQLPVDYMAELHKRYDGRVFAFDHFTLSHDPRENIRQFLKTIPDGTNLDLDIVCHSRGGLVSRVLSERLNEFDVQSRRLRVSRIVFVGAPNAGTPLADPKRMGDFLDVFTNVLDFLPDNGVTDILTMILSVVKQLAVGTLKGLDGLQSMDGGGEYAKLMNSGARSGDAKYFAITSNARPSEPGLKRLLVTKGLNTLMGGANDLVVPTDGVFKENGSGYFPIEEKLVLDGSDGVSHTHYFASDVARRRMLEWLTA